MLFRSALNNAAQGQITSAQNTVSGLLNGQMPAEYQANMENSIKSGVQNSMGSLLTDMGNRGILNSSVTNTGIQGINNAAADTMAQQYSNNIGLLSGLAGQQISGANAPITTTAAAQEAAQSPAINLWNASLGLNSGSTLGALSAVANQGTTTATNSQSSGGLFGSLLGSFAGNYATGLGIGKKN